MDGSFKLDFSLELKTLSGIGGDIPFESIRLIVFIIGCLLFLSLIKYTHRSFIFYIKYK